MEERHVEFNVAALHHSAQTSIKEAHGKVKSMSKLAEGGFNRVFTLTFEDGFEMIAKIPYHIAKPDRFATASEVATLALLRLQEIPVPEVYDYSYTAENDVGTEYILMEKAPGVCLMSKWLDMEDKEMRHLAHSFVQLEKKLFSLPFSATGSIYFKKDLNIIAPEISQAPLFTHDDSTAVSQFCIGPIVDYMFWYGRRAGLKLNRGPWTSPVDYLHSTAQKEIEWTKKFGRPMEPDFPYNACDGVGVQNPENYIQLLQDYQKLTPHLLPKDFTHPFNQPILRHPDAAPGNIFVSPDKGRVTCLIDWQHAVVQPRILAAGYPPTFENPDGTAPTIGAEPKLPANLLELDAEEQRAARQLFRQRLLFYGYHVITGGMNHEHMACLQDPLLGGRQMLLEFASRQWSGNLVTLKQALLNAKKFWEHLPDVEGIDCPISFSPADQNAFQELQEQWSNFTMYMADRRTRVCGMTEEGWVREKDYEEAKKRLEELKEEMRTMADGDEGDLQAMERGWPYRDRDEEY